MKLKYLMITTSILLGTGQVFASSHFDAEAEESYRSQSRTRSTESRSYMEYDIKELEALAQKLAVIKKIKETEAELPLIAALASDRIKEIKYREEKREEELQQQKINTEGIRNKIEQDKIIAFNKSKMEAAQIQAKVISILSETEVKVEGKRIANMRKARKLQMDKVISEESMVGTLWSGLFGRKIEDGDIYGQIAADRESQAKEKKKMQEYFSGMLSIEAPQKTIGSITRSGPRIEELD
ncbi:hypothetical protein IM40_10710 (plasmid) [Candidatus Paracaedimonas acanthamoebae]|nr:hypothetical protein IM40_10205 [Candidatus Paracaedimonas acanthamoebae]AIL13836.1 hypothetical protein IM40_10710 [Candidatus Paracaedimonas acanthamoebae]